MKGLNNNLRLEPKFDPYENCIQVPYKEGFNPKLDKNLEKNIVWILYGGKIPVKKIKLR